MKNEKQIIAGAIAAAIIVMAVVVFPFWNLIPNNVTETVKVVLVDESGCTAETHDGFDVKIGPCNAKAGDSITTSFDGKIRDRHKPFTP
ncbi:MAG: hypothetical protein D4R72_06325 [Nitrosopumilales archaeon]|nr:MAG: hypothetical protein D4R72_06325 [Nitrosopumilales archaeon]